MTSLLSLFAWVDLLACLVIYEYSSLILHAIFILLLELKNPDELLRLRSHDAGTF